MIPKRHENIPATAVFNPDAPEGWEWTEKTYDEEGGKHGIWRDWTLSGHLHGKEVWEHGILMENINFHPDGKISSHLKRTSENEQHCAFFKATCESSEWWDEDAHENIHSAIRYSADNGFSRYRVSYFDSEGNEVQQNGTPGPQRPASVHPDAFFFEEQGGWWVQNRLTIGPEFPIGYWARWRADGELNKIVNFGDDGSVINSSTYEGGKITEYRAYYQNGKLKMNLGSCGHSHLERLYDDTGRTINLLMWDKIRDVIKEETTRFYDGENLLAVRTRVYPGYVSYEAKRQRDGKLFCEFYSEDGKVELSGSVKDGLLFGEWHIQTENVRFDTTPFEKPVSADSPDFRSEVELLFYETSMDDIRKSADPEFLKKVSAIDWAEKIPDALLSMASSSKILRGVGLSIISGETFNQGSLNETTATVVPFFMELLTVPNSDKLEILRLLHWFAQTASYLAEDLVEDATQTIYKNEEGAKRWKFSVLGTVNEISKGWKIFRLLFDSKDQSVREKAVALMKYIPKEQTQDFIFSLIESGPESITAIAISVVADWPDPKLENLTRFLDSESELVKLVASIAIAEIHHANTPQVVIDELLSAFNNWNNLQVSYSQILTHDEHILGDIVYALAGIRTEQIQDLCGTFCNAIEEVDIRSAPRYGLALLKIGIGGKNDTPTKDVVKVLKTLAKSKTFNAFNVDGHEILDEWMLPFEEELFTFAEDLEKEEDPIAAIQAWYETD